MSEVSQGEQLQRPPLEVAYEDETSRILIDWGRTELVLSKLLYAQENSEFPYNLDSTRVPQDERHMPESLQRGGVEHASFLWATCYYMRGGIKSTDAFIRLSQMYETEPELFDFAHAATLDPKDIEAALSRNRLGFQEQRSKEWVLNAQRMMERWDGNPLKIFAGVDNYEECLERIHVKDNGEGFKGFREKMVSMITYYLMDADLIERFIFPLPVDVHVMRVTVANKMITFEGRADDHNIFNNETKAAMRKLYYDYAVEHEIDPIVLCNSVWLLSEALCGIQPGNITMEPEGRENRKGRATVLIPKPVYVDDPGQQRDYERSCAHCPLEETCEINLPTKSYYVSGELRARGERVRFPRKNELFNQGPPQQNAFAKNKSSSAKESDSTIQEQSFEWDWDEPQDMAEYSLEPGVAATVMYRRINDK